jgi:cyclic pyranopterin phosphate synthase
MVVTSKCNYRCQKCRPGGEGWAGEHCKEEELSADEIVQILKLANEVGFKHVKFTGGEPLLRRDICDIVSKTYKLNMFEDIQLVTNAYFLEEKAQALKEAGLSSITVSLDSVDAKKYAELTGVDGFPRVIAGLYECKKIGLPVTINSVIMKSNVNQLDGLIDIANQVGARLKLIDFMDVNDADFWESQYAPFKPIRDDLEKRAVETKTLQPPGGLGTPMPQYTLENGTKVLMRDATVGTNYHESCKNCVSYPCQDALISLRITHDGKLKRCLIRNDNLVDILEPLRAGNLTVVRERLYDSFKILSDAEYIPNAWKLKNGGKNGI